MYNNPSLKMDQIAKHFNIAVPEIYFLLETSGLPFQHRKKPTKKLSERTHSMIMAMHSSGIPATQIAERFGISRSTVYKRIERANNKTRKPVAQQPTRPVPAPIPQPKQFGFWARLIRRLWG